MDELHRRGRRANKGAGGFNVAHWFTCPVCVAAVAQEPSGDAKGVVELSDRFNRDDKRAFHGGVREDERIAVDFRGGMPSLLLQVAEGFIKDDRKVCYVVNEMDEESADALRKLARDFYR